MIDLNQFSGIGNLFSNASHGLSVMLLSVLFCNFVCADQIKSFNFEPGTTINLTQWEVCDVRLTATDSGTDPFELNVTADFNGPDGQALKVPVFYDGGKTWVLRFSAPAPGQWSWETKSTREDLDGKRGTVAVSPNTAPNRHGGLALNAKKTRHFFYEDGTPCSVLAFEADWLFALDYDNPNGTPKTEKLLKSLRANGVNQIVTTVYSYDVKWDKDPLLKQYPQYEFGGRDDIYPFLGSNRKPDFSSLNLDFFQKMDRMVHQMDQHDMVAHLMIYVWNKKVKWPAADSPADNRYFDYLIKRYQAFPNVLWDISKEALNNKRCSEPYAVERIGRIRNLDAYKRLITVHDGGFCQRHPQDVDFISWQMWTATIYRDMLEVTKKFPQKPVFNIEHGGYEESPFVVFPGDYDSPEVCLRRNYLIMFAGTYSTYYWQGAAWHVLIHDAFEQDELKKPKFEYYGHLQDFFARYPYSDFEPAPQENRSAYCLKNKDNTTYLVYLPKEHYQISSYRQRGFSRKGARKMIWFNTLTGEFQEADPEQHDFFRSPWKGEADAILVREY